MEVGFSGAGVEREKGRGFIASFVMVMDMDKRTVLSLSPPGFDGLMAMQQHGARLKLRCLSPEPFFLQPTTPR